MSVINPWFVTLFPRKNEVAVNLEDGCDSLKLSNCYLFETVTFVRRYRLPVILVVVPLV